MLFNVIVPYTRVTSQLRKDKHSSLDLSRKGLGPTEGIVLRRRADQGAACCTHSSPTPVTRLFTCDARYLFDFVCTFPRDRLGAARARPDLHTPGTVASVQISVASHSSQPFKRKGTHKSCRSTASGLSLIHI